MKSDLSLLAQLTTMNRISGILRRILKVGRRRTTLDRCYEGGNGNSVNMRKNPRNVQAPPLPPAGLAADALLVAVDVLMVVVVLGVDASAVIHISL